MKDKTRKYDISYNKVFHFNRKYSPRVYSINLFASTSKIKRPVLKMEVRENPISYKGKIIPFELVKFHCDKKAKRYLNPFINSSMTDIIDYTKRYYVSEYLSGILYSKDSNILSYIAQCYPMCKIKDIEVFAGG